MVDISNLTGLEKPFVKLIETFSEGLGIVGNDIWKFDARKIKRVGNEEAEAEKIKIIKKAEGEATKLEVLDRARKRVALEQYTNQTNLENTIAKSREILQGSQVSSVPVDKDWTMRFIAVAQDISKDEIQNLLARILAGEVQKPSTYALRTLDVIKSLSTSELQSFRNYVQFSSPNNGMFVRNPDDHDELAKYGLVFGDFVHLADIRFFNPSTELGMVFKTEEKIIIAGQLVTFRSQEHQNLKLPILKFTRVGEQISRLLPSRAMNRSTRNYVQDMRAYITSKGFEVL